METIEKLGRVGEAEKYIRKLGFWQVRVRSHGDMARIEVGADERSKLVEHADEIAERLKSLGFVFVAMDLTGYRSGSMNQLLS